MEQNSIGKKLINEVIVMAEKNNVACQISYDTTYTWNLNYDITELIYKTETNLHTWKRTYGYQRGTKVGEE